MSHIKNIALLAYLLLQYFLFRAGLGKPPEVDRFYHPGLSALDFLFGWRRKTRFVGGENCPARGPAVVAGNHIEIDDPFVMGNAIYLLSGSRIRPHAMMRDDFFTHLPGWFKKIADPDEVCRFIGAILITRHGADTTQLLPFVEVLREGGVFLIYPGRSRSRSGMFIDYREWIRSPGATAFFVAGAQEGRTEPTVTTIPVTRTCNPVTRSSTLVFGKPLYMAPGASQAERREFDYRLVVAMSNLIELNVPHVVSMLLYLHCLHGRGETVSVAAICRGVNEVFATATYSYMDPAAAENPKAEVGKTLRFLETKKMLKRKGGHVRLNRDSVLFAPTSFSRYKTQNPIKHMANQIIHLADVVRCTERAAKTLVTGA